jgi:hypothetical protein
VRWEPEWPGLLTALGLSILTACAGPGGASRPDPTKPVVMVQAPAGLSPEAGTRLARLLAAGLRDRGLAARPAREGQGRRVIAGSVRLEPRPEGRSLALIGWRVENADGALVGRYRQVRVVERAMLEAGDTALLALIADQAAGPLAKLAARAAPAPAEPPVAKVYLAPVDGAPGDGQASLTAAMRAALAARAVPLVDAIADDAYLLLGAVYLGPGDAGADLVEIYWTLIEPSGREIGVLSQDATVPKGALAGPWGDRANDLAAEALLGIIALLDQAGPLGQESDGR